jgi:hypothetical protein
MILKPIPAASCCPAKVVFVVLLCLGRSAVLIFCHGVWGVTITKAVLRGRRERIVEIVLIMVARENEIVWGKVLVVKAVNGK